MMGKSSTKNASKNDAAKMDEVPIVTESANGGSGSQEYVVTDADIVLESETETKGSTKIAYEGTMALAEAVAYFEAIAQGLKKGSITLRQGADTLTLTPEGPVEVEVKASTKKRKGKLAFEISWSAVPVDNFEIS